MRRRERADRIREQLEALYGQPAIPLDHTDPFTLLVAVLLSAQTTDKKVNQITPALFDRAPTPAAMAALSVEEIRELIREVGLAPQKAKALKRTGELLVEVHGSVVPQTFEELEALPGVGHKTASVVLNEAFGEATIAVDTHVFRVSNRTGLAPEATPEKVEKKLLQVTPDAYKRGAHHWLILHGRYTCLARKPGCPECVIRDLCQYDAKTGE